MPRIWSASARADRYGIRERNAERRHDNRISDSDEQRLNLVRVRDTERPRCATSSIRSLETSGRTGSKRYRLPLSGNNERWCCGTTAGL